MHDRSPSAPHFDQRERDVHFCATCYHIKPIHKANRVHFMCSRLGYETQPKWKFNCWTPRQQYTIKQEDDSK